MYEERFSVWQHWKSRGQLQGLGYPGVYTVAVSQQALAGNVFSWRGDVVYIGMTNSAAGLKGRLQQFDNTIAGKTGHGGADRVRYKHRDYERLCEQLHVAVAVFGLDPLSWTG